MVGKLKCNLLILISRRQYCLLSLFFCISEIFASPIIGQIEVGDWVLRSGHGRESALIMTLSKSEFSHIGMVVTTSPQIEIVHATTNDDPNHPNQVIRTTFKQFSAEEMASRVLVVRPTFLSAKQKQVMATHLLNMLGQPFVLVSKENSPRYCTTILYDAIRQEYPTFELSWQSVTLALVSGQYLFPQAFLEHADVEMIFDSAN